MKYAQSIFLLFCTFFLFHSISFAQDKVGDLIVGNWQPSNGRSVISIYKGVAANGENPDKYYGKIVWLIEPINEEGEPRKDINNPEKELRSRTIKGLVNLKDLEFTGDKKNRDWENGSIYDPNNGSTYSFKAEIPRNSDNLLEGRGYIGVSLFGRTDTWKRLTQKELSQLP